ncbi:exodeoxyribonuclease V subunit gamma [Vibrio sp. WJH972]
MFSVFHSNQLETLKIILVHLIKADPLDNPFTPETILVQSPGMSQWLKMELANEFGVAANIDFPLPATFIWDMFSQVLPDVPKRSAFNKEAMTWKLVTIIPTLLELDEFSPLKQYLSRDDSALRLFQLAGKIADIFDGYLVYRPDWIDSWQKDIPVLEIEEEHPWQPILWRHLYQETLALDQSHYHRGNLYQAFIDAIEKGEIDTSRLPKRLFIFGITALPPRYLDALKALSNYIDISLMFANPSQHYWGEIRDQKYLASLQRKQIMLDRERLAISGEVSIVKPQILSEIEHDSLHVEQQMGNSLLASMGKLGRDNLYLLSQLELEEHEYFIAPQDTNLLHQIQSDILNLDERANDQALETSEHKAQIEDTDSSVSLHSCHSPIREVEVLYDMILSWFDQDPTLQARDIIVMVADINSYSAAIEAVFGNAPYERYIPYSISDRTTDHESPILTAFLQLLALPQSRCLASELLALLETPAILRRFGIAQDEFELARRWVEKTGIRWGLNHQSGEEFGFQISEKNTWQSGIERLLVGYSMAENVEIVSLGTEQFAPFNDVQGMGAELAGKLAHYIETISHYRSALSKTHSIDDWRTLLATMLDDFFTIDLEDDVALNMVRETVHQLEQQLSDAQYEELLDPDVVRYYLQTKLSTTRVSQRFLAGQVNFCTLMPMRSIPFKVVCLLGMNEGTYPRANQVDGFDLMHGRSRIGDRSRRDDERYLFLEALLSARQRFYVSYIGQSIKDNSERLPSIFVSELLEYCQQNYCVSGDEQNDSDDSAQRLESFLTHHHPMVPYSPQAFTGVSPSYAQEWFPVAKRIEPESKQEGSMELRDYLLELESPINIDLTELQAFWRNPAKFFFNRRLNVAYEDYSIIVEDIEPFSFDSLTSFGLRAEVIEHLVTRQNEDVETLKQVKRAQGLLPKNAFGEIEFESHLVQATPVAEKVTQLTQTPLDDVELTLEFYPFDDERSVQVNGWLTQRYEMGMLRYRAGAIRSADKLQGWVDHLLLNLAGYDQSTHLIGFDKKKGIEHITFTPIDADVARHYIERLLRYFFNGMNQPLAYFPKTALVGVEAQRAQEDDVKLSKKMADAYNGSQMISGEGSNPYYSRLWPELTPNIEARLLEIGNDVLAPICVALAEQEQS